MPTRRTSSPFVAALLGAIFFHLLSGGGTRPGRDTLLTFAAALLGAATVRFCDRVATRLAARRRGRQRPGPS